MCGHISISHSNANVSGFVAGLRSLRAHKHRYILSSATTALSAFLGRCVIRMFSAAFLMYVTKI